jgi:death-on-curing family protein
LRYLKPLVILQVYRTLRTIYTKRGEGATFSPEFAPDLVWAKLDQSANRPRHEFGKRQVHVGLFKKTAALAHAIVKNHVFGNGNKRTAFLTTQLALSMNGWHLNMPPELIAFMMLRLAGKNRPLPIEGAAELLMAYSTPAEGQELAAIKTTSDELLKADLIWVDEPDEFPQSALKRTPDASGEFTRVIVEHQLSYMEQDESDELVRAIPGIRKFFHHLLAFARIEEHKQSIERRRRTRMKRCGRRLPPHLGGRTTPRICPPITRAKQRLAPLHLKPVKKQSSLKRCSTCGGPNAPESTRCAFCWQKFQ